MVNRLVSVGDDFTLPGAVKVANGNLPEHVQPATLSATILDKITTEASEPTGVITTAIATEVAASPVVAGKLDAAAAVTQFGDLGKMLETARVDALGAARLRRSQGKALADLAANVATPVTGTTFQANGQNCVLHLPADFDRRVPVPLIIRFFGVGENQVIVNNENAMFAAALDAGYAVATSALHGDSYGSPNAMADTKALIDAVLEIIPVSGIAIYGNSMGGIGALNAVTTNTVPGVLGVYLTEPTYDLLHRYNASAGHATTIRNAYGIASDGSDYATKTAGYDPALQPAWAFRGVPFHIRSSPSDATVPAAAHADLLAAKLAGYSPVTRSTASGGHSSPSHYDPAPLLAFLAECFKGLTKKPKYDPVADTSLLVNFDAQALGMTAGASVASWAASGGIHNAPLTNVDPNRPTFQPNQVNGLPAVVFDADDALDSGGWGTNRAVPITIFEVFYHDFNNPGDSTLWTGRSGVYVNANIKADDTIDLGAGSVGTFNPAINATPGWKVIGVVYNGANSRLFFNSTTPVNGTTGTGGSAALPGVKLGAGSSGATSGNYGHKVARFTVVGRAVTDAEAAEAMTALAKRYAITLA